MQSPLREGERVTLYLRPTMTWQSAKQSRSRGTVVRRRLRGEGRVSGGSEGGSPPVQLPSRAAAPHLASMGCCSRIILPRVSSGSAGRLPQRHTELGRLRAESACRVWLQVQALYRLQPDSFKLHIRAVT